MANDDLPEVPDIGEVPAGFFVKEGRWTDPWGRDGGDAALDDNGYPTQGPGAEDDPDLSVNYRDMKVDELKAELSRRLEAGREIDTSGITKKSELIAALVADDEAQAAEQA